VSSLLAVSMRIVSESCRARLEPVRREVGREGTRREEREEFERGQRDTPPL